LSELARLLPFSTGRGSQGQLQIAKHDLGTLAKAYGTPLYVFDAETISRHVKALQHHLSSYPGETAITYAAKAYFSLGMARRLNKLGLGVDVVSLSEMEVARLAGFRSEDVHLHGNNKSDEELTAALGWGIHCIVVDSLDELDLLENIARQADLTASIWLRITPGLDVDTHPYLRTANHASKFGLPISDGQAAEAIQRAKKSPWLSLKGLHMHLGSQIRQSQPYAEAIDLLVHLAEGEEYIPIEISPGGGWGVSYQQDDPIADEAQWIQGVSCAVQDLYTRRGWPLPRLIIEPGRWLVAKAGVAIYTIGTSKRSADGTYYVSVDGGMADNPRPALYHAAYTALLADRPDAERTVKTTVVGKYCESGDELISGIMLPEMKRGDLLVVPVAGAYQLSLSSNYNLAPRPTVLWLEGEQVEVLQRREVPHEHGWWVSEGEDPL
jgi:diaminopimelate decarboxylase